MLLLISKELILQVLSDKIAEPAPLLPLQTQMNDYCECPREINYCDVAAFFCCNAIITFFSFLYYGLFLRCRRTWQIKGWVF